MSSPTTPLLRNNKLSGRMPCATFLLESDLDTYYKGGIYKNQKSIAFWATALKQAISKGIGFKEFISYKFQHAINGELRTFCITFRKKTTSWFRGYPYHIRLSLIERDESNIDKVKCKQKGESMMLTPAGTLEHDGTLEDSEYVRISDDGTMYVPTSEISKHKFNDNFSSITSGQFSPEISEVEGMDEITEGELPKDVTGAVSNIKRNIEILGKTLIYHCDEQSSTVSSGGATRRHTRLSRRRKSLFKRKGKKSYRKKKYGKTKKSRRFRRSVRSRR
jgi:hypothetical protein